MHTHRPLALALILGLVTVPAAHAQATAPASVCKDGSTSAVSGRGACTAHGGIDRAATKSAKSAAKASAKAARASEKANEKADERAAKESRTTTAAAATRTQVTCTDGSLSAGGRGACRGHGGIQRAGAPMAPAPAAVPAQTPRSHESGEGRAADRSRASQATGGSGSREDNNASGAVAQCKDGLYSHSANRRGACSRHGGVARWMTQ